MSCFMCVVSGELSKSKGKCSVGGQKKWHKDSLKFSVFKGFGICDNMLEALAKYRLAWCAAITSGVRDAEARRLDEAKKCAARKALNFRAPEAHLLSYLRHVQHHRQHVRKTTETRSVSSAASVLIDLSVPRTRLQVVVDLDGRTSSLSSSSLSSSTTTTP